MPCVRGRNGVWTDAGPCKTRRNCGSGKGFNEGAPAKSVGVVDIHEGLACGGRNVVTALTPTTRSWE
ncbi:hypothetical protein [Lysobacter gummosus]|uniref:hypothetical protein n=1 Tax=Lysobacter gummosus TaxID=262324 RepID=UPI003639D3F1